jgi:hypothetical protein
MRPPPSGGLDMDCPWCHREVSTAAEPSRSGGAMSHIPPNRPWDLPALDPADAAKENRQTLVWMCALCCLLLVVGVLIG